MGIYSDFDRKDRDFYPTPFKAVRPLFQYLKSDKRLNFIEPCGGDGRLVTLLEQNVPNLHCKWASDIDPQINAMSTKDGYIVFHKTDVMNEDWNYIASQVEADYFITNPPWLNTKKSGYLRLSVIQKLANCKPTWLLLAGNYLMNEDMWNHPVLGKRCVLDYCKKVVPIGRVKWEEGSKDVGKQDAAWYLFDWNHSGGPTIMPREKFR